MDEPFAVYTGGGALVPIERYLQEHPRPEYPALRERLEDLAAGRFGERAGDVLLLAHFGDRSEPAGRYYFAHPHRSGHGSPSRGDSEVSFVVAQRHRSSAELAEIVRPAGSRLQGVAEVLLRLPEL